MKIGNRFSVLFDLLLLEILAIILTSYCFRGATSICDGVMHLSKVRILLDNLEAYGYFLRWNPYWYFGVPMLRVYSPLSYYMVAFLSWILRFIHDFTIVDIIMTWTYLVFSLITISTYFLAKKIGLKRAGCLGASILFLTSGNLILFWGSGSYPNVTGVAFSPLALLLYLRAVEKKRLLDIFAAGISISIVFLIYAINAVTLVVFILTISIVQIINEPSLFLVRRGVKEPPEYTLILPKILLKGGLIAVALSLWWMLPYLTTFTSASSKPGLVEEESMVYTSIGEQIVRVIGLQMDINTPGVGHLMLALTGCIILVMKRQVVRNWVFPCIILSLIFGLAPWLGIPVGIGGFRLIYWFRFPLYLSLFSSLCGGIALDYFEDLFERLSHQTSSSKSGKIYRLLIITMILLVSTYPVISSSSIVFEGYDLSKPNEIQLLEAYTKLGERVGIDTGYDFNIYTDIFQSGGGNILAEYMTNEYAYTFWRYLFADKDPRLLSYFTRNYNVRWFISDTGFPGLRQIAPRLFEVEGFNSSFVEITSPNNTVVLFIGDDYEYSSIFTSSALVNPQDVLFVYGGKNLEEYSLDELKNFDVIYLHALRYANLNELTSLSNLLSGYVKNGGSIILDTGDIAYHNEMEDLPNPFPVTKTSVYEESHLLLNALPHPMTENINFTKFLTNETQSVSYAVILKTGAEALVYDEGRPVLAYWRFGEGKVIWTGLRLPYLTMSSGSEEEAKFLVNIIRFASRSQTEMPKASVDWKYPNPETISVNIKNAAGNEAVWVKMSYYPGWTAQIIKPDSKPLKIFQAGPDTMLVFPKQSGDYTLELYFDKTLDVQIGEWASLLSMLTIAGFTLYHIFALLKNKAPSGWKHTRHTGSGSEHLKNQRHGVEIHS